MENGKPFNNALVDGEYEMLGACATTFIADINKTNKTTKYDSRLFKIP
jgi:hypothetical protein